VKITRTARFKKAWKELSQNERKLPRKALQNMITNISYPALRVKKMQAVDNIWEARISGSLRMTFQIQGDIIILRNIGRHDETLGNP
jgi:mRNA interferase RelE/StbE